MRLEKVEGGGCCYVMVLCDNRVSRSMSMYLLLVMGDGVSFDKKCL